MKYVCTKDGWKHRVLSYTQVKECINLLYPGTILPQDISNIALLNHFQIKELKEIFPDIDDNLKPYCDNTATQPFQDSNGIWCVQWKTYVNERKLDDAWGKVRLERDKILLDTDWIEQSSIVTDECKSKYVIYRQLLRDSLNIVDYPHEVVFPTAPSINYVNTFTRAANKPLEYSEAELEKIKNYTPPDEEITNWNVFLREWYKVKLTKNQQYVNNLILLHTNIKHETIF